MTLWILGTCSLPTHAAQDLLGKCKFCSTLHIYPIGAYSVLLDLLDPSSYSSAHLWAFSIIPLGGSWIIRPSNRILSWLTPVDFFCSIIRKEKKCFWNWAMKMWELAGSFLNSLLHVTHPWCRTVSMQLPGWAEMIPLGHLGTHSPQLMTTHIVAWATARGVWQRQLWDGRCPFAHKYVDVWGLTLARVAIQLVLLIFH